MKIGTNANTNHAMALTFLVALFPAITGAQPSPIPEGFSEHPFGEPAPLPGGGQVTVSKYERDIPYSKTNQFGDLIETISSLIHVEMCAGTAELSKMAAEVYFSLTRPIVTGHESIKGTPSKDIREPGLQPGFVPLSVEPGECRHGWVAFTTLGRGGDKALEGASSITFDPAVLGIVPPEQQVKLAWRLPVD